MAILEKIRITFYLTFRRGRFAPVRLPFFDFLELFFRKFGKQKKQINENGCIPKGYFGREAPL